MNFIEADSHAQCLCYDKDAFIILVLQQFCNINERFGFQFLQAQIIDADFQGPDGLEQCAFKAAVQRHDFPCSFHLRSQCTVCQCKFFKRPAREFDDAVIQSRFKACRCLSCNSVGNLIQRQSCRNLGCNFGNRIPRRFGSQCR